MSLLPCSGTSTPSGTQVVAGTTVQRRRIFHPIRGLCMIPPTQTMQFKQLLSDDDAVSPVIGVILMVAITVILAAVIATFVLGLGEQVSSTAPQASFSFEYNGNDNVLTVTHDGGDTIKAGSLYFRGQLNSDDVGSTISTDDTWSDLANNYGSNSKVTSTASSTQGGESAVVGGDYAKFPTDSDSQIRIIFQGTNSDSSATLASWEGPDA